MVPDLLILNPALLALLRSRATPGSAAPRARPCSDVRAGLTVDPFWNLPLRHVRVRASDALGEHRGRRPTHHESQALRPDPHPATDTLMQIGDVAERTGLSLRTIRHYEEVGLLADPQRSQGGFRLYTEDAVSRLLLVKQMKPLDFTLEEMREIIELRERLSSPRLSTKTRAGLMARLDHYQQLADAKLADLEGRLRNARDFAETLSEPLR